MPCRYAPGMAPTGISETMCIRPQGGVDDVQHLFHGSTAPWTSYASPGWGGVDQSLSGWISPEDGV